MTKLEAPSLSDEQRADVLGLTREADSVELKLTVSEAEHRAATAALGVDPLDAQIRQVFFFDTPDLSLYQNGLVVRARRVQHKGDDTVVKLRPVVPGELPEDLRNSASFGVEVDAMPGGFVCSGSMKGTVTGKADVRSTVAGEHPIHKLFSNEQREMFTAHAPPGIDLDDLSVLGAIFVLKLKFSPKRYDRKLVVEFWLYPDYSAVLELSTKCDPSEAFQVAAETRAFLAEDGISLSGEQQAKTRKALQFFSDRLRAEASASR